MKKWSCELNMKWGALWNSLAIDLNAQCLHIIQGYQILLSHQTVYAYNVKAKILNLKNILEPSTTQVTKPIYKTALYDWVKRIRSEPDKVKTKLALQRLEQMESFKRIKDLFPIYKRNFRLTDTVKGWRLYILCH